LLIWAMTDTGFSVNWAATNNASLHTAYTDLVSLMATSYHAKTNYLGGAEFLGAVHNSANTLYQDLVLPVPEFHSLASPTPEPSSLLIAGLGALGWIGYGWRKRSLQHAD